MGKDISERTADYPDWVQDAEQHIEINIWNQEISMIF
jgi:hypothetical protein